MDDDSIRRDQLGLIPHIYNKRKENRRNEEESLGLAVGVEIRAGNEPSRARLGSPRLGHLARRAWLGSVISRAVERDTAWLVIGSRAGSSQLASHS